MVVDLDDPFGFDEALVIDPRRIGRIQDDRQTFFHDTVFHIVGRFEKLGFDADMFPHRIDVLVRIGFLQPADQSPLGTQGIGIGILVAEDADRLRFFQPGTQGTLHTRIQARLMCLGR